MNTNGHLKRNSLQCGMTLIFTTRHKRNDRENRNIYSSVHHMQDRRKVRKSGCGVHVCVEGGGVMWRA